MNNAPPIEHWSYTSMMQFLRNGFMFKKKYVDHIFEEDYSVASVIGSACHAALAIHYLQPELDKEAIVDIGLTFLQHFDKPIDWGKTGNPEDLVEAYRTAMDYWYAEEPSGIVKSQILSVEEGNVEYFEINGKQVLIPAKAYSDIILRNPAGELEIWDPKFTKYFSDEEKDNPARAMQAMFNFHVVMAKYKEPPVRMIFAECKRTKNRDGSPQIKLFEVDFRKSLDYFQMFYALYEACTEEICRENRIFLPNFQDMFDSSQTWDDYKKQIVPRELPVFAFKHPEPKRKGRRKAVKAA